MADEAGIRRRFDFLSAFLDERLRRLVAAAESEVIGYGGVSSVSRATGVSRRAIATGIQELRQSSLPPKGSALRQRVRKPGGGRKKTVNKDPTLPTELERLVEPTSRGDPESPLRWTCKSVRNLAEELKQQGHRVSHQIVADLLHAMEYSLQANRKTREGTAHPDRNAQFEHINAQVQRVPAARAAGRSRWTRRRRNWSGDFKNGGREWRPQGEPEKVRVHDFLDPELGKATPYGVYDSTHNEGWVSVGIDHDTAAFAVDSIRRWWQKMGQPRYPGAKRAADHGRRRRQQRRRACACGRCDCRSWPTRLGLAITSAIFRRAPASGTRSSIACSATSRKTGVASRLSATK